MKLFNILMILAVLGSCSKKKHDGNETDNTPPAIKIMTYNIHHGAPPGGPTNDIRLEDIAAVINRQKPDLVALQEVDSMTGRAPVDEAKKLGALTGMHYYFSKTMDYQGGKYGDAILSRFPILDTKHYTLPMPDPSGEPRAAGIVTVEPFPGMKINFMSTHLDITSNREAQVKALNVISKASVYPLILGGDLNATPGSTEINTLEKEFQPACTANCPLTAPSGKPAKTIDYIVLNPKAAKAFHILSYNVVNGIYASDHLPLIMYLTKQ